MASFPFGHLRCSAWLGLPTGPAHELPRQATPPDTAKQRSIGAGLERNIVNWLVRGFEVRLGQPGGCVMPDYRLYCLDGAGRISIAEWITADTDDEAIAKAQERVRGGRKCEIWQRRRLVKALDIQDLS